MNGRRETFYAYDNVHKARTEVIEVTDLEQLSTVLRSAQSSGRTVTLRGGGYSLDSQALGGDLTVLLSGEVFSHVGDVTVSRKGATVTAGAMATWRTVLGVTAGCGYVPPSTVTGGEITVGGSVSSNCLSRFSGTWGEESSSIEALKVMLSDGTVVSASASAPRGSFERRVFEGVVGGLGGLGVVLEATYRLRKVNASGPARKVLTHFKPVDRRDFSWGEFTEGVQKDTLDVRTVVRALGARAYSQPLPGHLFDAVSATAWFRHGAPRGLMLRSRHVSSRFALDAASLYESPGVLRQAAEWALCHDPLAGFAQSVFKLNCALEHRAVDALEPFTFFMDGNVAARSQAHQCGKRLTAHQQTFMVPYRSAAGFCAEIEVLTRELHPTIFDFLYLGKDRSGVLLSPVRDLDAFALTLGYQTLDGERLPTVRALFKNLSRRCADLGGRVSLVKNVYANDGVLREMYSDGLKAYLPLKRELDPTGMFTNGLLARLLGDAYDKTPTRVMPLGETPGEGSHTHARYSKRAVRK